jgi:hypothetical protein
MIFSLSPGRKSDRFGDCRTLEFGALHCSARLLTKFSFFAIRLRQGFRRRTWDYGGQVGTTSPSSLKLRRDKSAFIN